MFFKHTAVMWKTGFFPCLLLDLCDVMSDEDEKENMSPDELPTTVIIDCFGKTFEDAVRSNNTV